MAVITNQITPVGGYNNLGCNWITPITASQNIVVGDDDSATNTVCEFDVTGLAIKVDTISELTAAAGVTIDGVLLKDGGVDGLAIGTDVQAYDATLAALAALDATAGLLAQTGADTFARRTLTGTTNKIDVTNGDGASGNPTVTISPTYVGQTSITTLGTISTGVWSGTEIAVAKGGTGATNAATARSNLGAAASGSNSDITALTNCPNITDNANMTIGTTSANTLSFQYGGLPRLVLGASNNFSPASPGTANLGDSINYFNGVNFVRLNFLGLHGTSSKNPASDAVAAWVEVQKAGSTYYIPLYAA